MEYYFVGSIYPEDFLAELRDKGAYVDMAANTFQNALLAGFNYYLNRMTVYSMPVIHSWPNLSLKRFKKHTFSTGLSNITQVNAIGFTNFPIWKMVSKFLNLSKELRRAEKCHSNVLIIYALHSPFLMSALINKKRFHHICVIVPDLPEYMSDRGNILYRIGKILDRKIINFCIKRFSSFVLLSSHMRDKLPINNKETEVIEGIYHSNLGTNESVVKENNPTILYTGQISNRYGVFDLIKAFKLIEDDKYRLWLCGTCDEMSSLEDCLKNDKRITYFGLLSKDEVRTLQKKATVLVNPRSSKEDYTLYSFPSKTMEYLASATPTLMSRLPAIPEDYYEHLFFFEDESVEGMALKIKEVCNFDKTYLIERGKGAAEFVLTQKNAKTQVKKIIDLINKN